MANSVDPDQAAPICSGSTLFATIRNLSVMLGNYLQQTTSADDIFKSIFSWRFKGYDLTWKQHIGNITGKANTIPDLKEK